jgi:hypothetical protein
VSGSSLCVAGETKRTEVDGLLGESDFEDCGIKIRDAKLVSDDSANAKLEDLCGR